MGSPFPSSGCSPSSSVSTERRRCNSLFRDHNAGLLPTLCQEIRYSLAWLASDLLDRRSSGPYYASEWSYDSHASSRSPLRDRSNSAPQKVGEGDQYCQGVRSLGADDLDRNS